MNNHNIAKVFQIPLNTDENLKFILQKKNKKSMPAP